MSGFSTQQDETCWLGRSQAAWKVIRPHRRLRTCLTCHLHVATTSSWFQGAL